MPCQRCPAAIWVGLPPGVLAPLGLGAQTRCRHPATGRSECFCGSRTKHGGGLGSGGVRALPRTRGRLRCIRRRRGLCWLSAGTLAWQFLRSRGHFLGNVSNRQIVRCGGDGAHGYFLLVVLLRHRVACGWGVPSEDRTDNRLGRGGGRSGGPQRLRTRRYLLDRGNGQQCAPHPAAPRRTLGGVPRSPHSSMAVQYSDSEPWGSPAMLTRFLRRADHRGPAMGRDHRAAIKRAPLPRVQVVVTTIVRRRRSATSSCTVSLLG
jgi:hypothetical protein